MNFTDYLFIPSFLIMSLVYFIVPGGVKWCVLLAASILFYLSWGVRQIVYLLLAVIIAWACGMTISRIQEKTDAAAEKTEFKDKQEKAAFLKAGKDKCKYVLWAGLFFIVGALVLVKLKRFIPEGRFSIIVPLGISYYTMSLAAYMADVYWKKDKAEKNPLKLLLFAAYFPKILMGPISRHRLSAKGMFEGCGFDYDRFCFGLQRMLWGFCKKLVIADRLALFTDNVFGMYVEYHGSMLLVAAIFAAFQLYCDFSGCMDIALGASEALGIKLEENFERPFFSSSAAEFWRRWHITLGTWFKDYIYMPVSASPHMIKLSGRIRARFGKRAGRAFLTIIPTGIVWLLTGLWHGTGLNYVVWGVYWGALIIFSAVFDPEIKKLDAFLHIDVKSAGWKAFRIIRTFGLFVFSRIIVLPGSVHGTLSVCKRILTNFAPWQLFDGTLLTLGLDGPDFILAVIMVIALLVVSFMQERGVCIRSGVAKFHIVPRWICYFALIFFVLIFGIYGAEYDAASFVYMNY